MAPNRTTTTTIIAAALAAAASCALADDAVNAQPSAERRQELRHLVAHDCGSCHGLTLAGGLGPALLPQALADKPDAYLSTVILYGKPGTAMPPWRPFLSDAEAAWIAQELKRGLRNDR